MLTLEGAQAGLSWETVLKKREGYREAFHGFDIARVAEMTPDDVERLVAFPGIVRHRGKIESTISNAKACLDDQKEFGSLSNYLWGLAGGSPKINRWSDLTTLPSSTPESDAMSKALRKRGFRFVGSTTLYAFMQACGMVDDHFDTCFRKSA
jgi:DNA-3-methyladenine glycosylase I